MDKNQIWAFTNIGTSINADVDADADADADVQYDQPGLKVNNLMRYTQETETAELHVQSLIFKIHSDPDFD